MIEVNEIRKYTIDYLGALHIPTNENLPLLDLGKQRRSLQEIGSRICLLTCFKSLAEYPEDSKDIKEWVIRESLEPYLSEKEREILQHPLLENQVLVELSWYKESLYAMLWTVGIVGQMNFPIASLML